MRAHRSAPRLFRRMSPLARVLAPILAASVTLFAQQPQAPQPPMPVFRSSINLILVDVVVRDRSGAIVRGLTRDDFELIEDGAPQQIESFAFEDITSTATPITQPAALLNTSGASAAAPIIVTAPDAPPANDLPTQPLTTEDVAGHRMLTLVFDTSSMQPDDVQKAIDSAMTWVDEQMSPADLGAVAAINTQL
ncbi:MAG: VWA domain-containing protein, partial [Acidobacteriaceae bacterium]|nr:VWA domain-containing protein [Acidobacteriaceae bacterium]